MVVRGVYDGVRAVWVGTRRHSNHDETQVSISSVVFRRLISSPPPYGVPKMSRKMSGAQTGSYLPTAHQVQQQQCTISKPT